MTGLPRSATLVAHGYTAADMYDIARYAVLTDRVRASVLFDDRIEAAWSAIAGVLMESDEPPRRHELVFLAREASNEVTGANMRHHGIDKRAATFGEQRLNFDRYWFRFPGSTLEDRVVDEVAVGQIWPTIRLDQQQALLALSVHEDYAVAAKTLGLNYNTFCQRVRKARLAFFRHWHEGEAPSDMWGRDKRRGRGNTGRTAVRVHARRRSAALRGDQPDANDLGRGVGS
jgi:hypothetical protein